MPLIPSGLKIVDSDDDTQPKFNIGDTVETTIDLKHLGCVSSGVVKTLDYCTIERDGLPGWLYKVEWSHTELVLSESSLRRVSD